MKQIKLPSTFDRVMVVGGPNNSGVTSALRWFCVKNDFEFFPEILYPTKSRERLKSMISFCKRNDNVVIDNIENLLDFETQQQIIEILLNSNPRLRLVCSAHSPAVVMHGWTDCVVNVLDYK